MKKANLLIKVALWTLVLFGFLGALNISYLNATSNNVCPHIGFIPACYVVLLAFSMMLLSLIINHTACRQHLFIAGWCIAFLFALFGSTMEFLKGDICPVLSNNIPLCFVSLALCITIFILFLLSPHEKVYKTHNKK